MATKKKAAVDATGAVIDPDTLYRCLAGFISPGYKSGFVPVPVDARHLGDHQAVLADPARWAPDDTPTDIVHRLRGEITRRAAVRQAAAAAGHAREAAQRREQAEAGWYRSIALKKQAGRADAERERRRRAGDRPPLTEDEVAKIDTLRTRRREQEQERLGGPADPDRIRVDTL